MDDVVENWASDDERLEVVRVEVDEPGGWTHEVAVEDWIAHLHEDVVEEFVAAAARLPEVEAAHHEDREIVILIAPGLSARELGEWAHAWFDAHLPAEPVDAS